MLALKISKHGSVADLNVVDVAKPSIGPDEVLVEIEASAINPSDILSAEGRFGHARLPRILGRDFAGRVIDGPADLIGKQVWGAAGDLGISRDGTHAEFITIPRDAVAIRPTNLTPEEAASVGVPFQTAWASLVLRGHVAAGDCVIVSGATGAVGSAAIQIAFALGATVVALVRSEADAARVDVTKVAAIASIEASNLADIVRNQTGGTGAQLAINAVGADVFETLYGSLADSGGMVVFSVMAGREINLDLLSLYRRNLTIYGVNTVAYDVVEGAAIARSMTPLFESGVLAPPLVVARFPISRAPEAYLASRLGKTVLVPDTKFDE